MTPAEIIKFPNGMVMAFDDRGEQMPDLQGRYADVRDACLLAAGPRTRFGVGVWGVSIRHVDRKDW